MTDAKVLWDAQNAKFGASDVSNELYVMENFHDKTMEDNRSVVEQVHEALGESGRVGVEHHRTGREHDGERLITRPDRRVAGFHRGANDVLRLAYVLHDGA